jgi:hypothetical protein
MSRSTTRRCRVCGLLLLPIVALSSGASIAANMSDRDPIVTILEPLGHDDRLAVGSNSVLVSWPPGKPAVMRDL